MAAADAPAASDLAMNATLAQKLADPAAAPQLGDVTAGAGASASSSSSAPAAAKPADAKATAPLATTTTDKKTDATTAAADEKPPEPLRGAVIGGQGGGIVITMGQLLAGVAALGFLLCALFLLWWDPHLYLLGGAVATGLGGGVLASYLYYGNLRRKAELQELLSMDPGLKGCSYLLGKVPSWMSLTEREKMEWLNRLLSELWPYYDRGICSMVKDVVEPIMESLRPPGIIKRIFFQEFTFGTAPFRVEGIAVKEDPTGIDMELDVRWSGDANITLGIDLPAGGEFTRLTPKVTDIVFVATLKVIMKPLVDEIPGFAGVAVALKSPPTIKYRLNFGALSGGSITTAPIVAFINFIVKEVIVGMLLWPKRITVPILGTGGVLTDIMGHPPMPDVDLEVERLNGRQQGVVKVTVLSARDLKAYDTLTGKSDPFVELFTTQDHRCRTKVVKRSLAPVWGETFYLPVLEKDQVLRCEVFDHDDVNVAAATSSGLKIWQAPGKVLDAREFMGRAAVPLAPFIAEEGLEDDRWFALGKADWTNVMGPGKGEGQVRLGLQYRAVENIAGEEIENAAQGLLLVSVIRAEGLGGDAKSGPLRFVTAKLTKGQRESKGAGAAMRARFGAGADGGGVSHNTPQLRGDSPRWMSDNKFTFYDVELEDTISLTVVEAGLVTNATIGSFKLSVPEVVKHRQRSRWTKAEQAGYYHRAFPLTGTATASNGGASLEVEMEFLPYW